MPANVNVLKAAATTASFALFFGTWWGISRFSGIRRTCCRRRSWSSSPLSMRSVSSRLGPPLVRCIHQSATPARRLRLRGPGRRAARHRLRLCARSASWRGPAAAGRLSDSDVRLDTAGADLVRSGRPGDHLHGGDFRVLADLHAGLSGHPPDQFAIYLGRERAWRQPHGYCTFRAVSRAACRICSTVCGSVTAKPGVFLLPPKYPCDGRPRSLHPGLPLDARCRSDHRRHGGDRHSRFLVERFAFDRIERLTIGRWRRPATT